MKDQLANGLARLAALARQEDWRAGEAEGLTPTQGDALRLIMRRTAGVRLSALAMLLSVSQPTTSDAIAALERKGLVDKLADPSDGRAMLIRVTRAGRALARRWPMSFSAVTEAMSDADQATLYGIVVRTIANLQRQGAISRQRMCQSCAYFQENAHPGKPRAHHCGLINQPIGDVDVRIDCPEHEETYSI